MDITKHTLTLTKFGHEIYIYHEDGDDRFFAIATDMRHFMISVRSLSGVTSELYVEGDGIVTLDASKYEHTVTIVYKRELLTVDVRKRTITKVRCTSDVCDLADDDMYFVGMVASEYDKVERLIRQAKEYNNAIKE